MDINCAKCMEPWDAYGVRNGDMEPDEARRFHRGEGCPCCHFGQKLPIFVGQIFENRNYDAPASLQLAEWLPIGKPGDSYYTPAWTGAPEGTKERQTGILFLDPHGPDEGTRVTVIHTEPQQRDYGDKIIGASPWDGIVHFTLNGEEYSVTEKEFRVHFKLVETAADRDRAADMALEAAKSACDASDEDPITILIRRGVI